MAENKHIIKVTTKGAEKSKKQLKGVSNGLKSMAKSVALAGAAYFGARGLINAIKSSLTLYAEQQLAEVKLESALGRTSATLKKYASALQQTTRFGDELILQGMAQLAFFIKDEEQLKIATKATLDLASAKGMDLVQAADLVAKSVGSSTNALSRYGIAAEGAVGSEERLLSITDEIANLFGGQAEATTKSYQGALDQLSNSFGDMQEKIGQALAPTIQSLAETFTDLLSVPVSETLEEERNKFIQLTTVLQNVNTSASTRKRIISELQTLYPEYIGNLNLETASMEEIKDMTEKATDALQDRIVQQKFAEQFVKNKEKTDLKLLQLYDLEMGSMESLDAMNRTWLINMEKTPMAFELMIEVINRAILANEAEEKSITAKKVAFEEWLQSKLGGTELLNVAEGGGGEGDPVVTGFEAYEAAMVERLRLQMEEEAQQMLQQDNMAEFIRLHEDEAAALGLVTDATKAEMAAKAGVGQANQKMVSDLQTAGREFKAFQKISKAVSIAQTLYDTYEAAQAAYKSFTKSPQALLNPPLYQALGIAAAVAATAAGLAKVQQIKKAQYGADFVTSGPQMLMVGEAGAEQVSVTPLEGPNLEGPQGQGITLNINNPIMTESFVEDNVIPQIREGLRLGENMGV